MKWYHFSVEYFEDLRNVNHCEFLIMRKEVDSGKYILENKLRTWSELKRERALAAKEKEKNNPAGSQANVSEKDKEKERKLEAAVASPTAVPTRKKWGGCPNGCDHGKHLFRKDNSMHAMQLNGKPSSPATSPVVSAPENSSSSSTLPTTTTTSSLTARRQPALRRWQSSSEEDEDDPRGRLTGPRVDVQKSLNEVVSSPDGTPSFISVEDRLRSRLKSPRNDFLLNVGGRDFGGSASGNTSRAGSDMESEFSAEEDTRKKRAASASARARVQAKLSALDGDSVGSGKTPSARKDSGMGRGAMADALGDQSDVGSDGGSDFEDLEKAEREDKGLRGSVY